MKSIKFLEKNEKELVRFIQKLIQTPSQNQIDPEKNVAQVIVKKLKEFGFNPQLVDNKNRPSVLCFVNKASGKKLLLDAPLDTVSTGDLKKWKYPPFSARIVNGKLYGRGAADCKAGIGIFCFVAAAIAQEKIDGQLILAFDSDEQSGNFSGIKEVLKRIKPDAAIIGYPDPEIAIGARGWLRLKITTLGKPAHTGARYKKGFNAITKMVKVINALESLKMDFKKNKFFPFGPKLTISQIQGGRAINIVPDECVIHVDIRLVPNQAKEKVLREIKRAIKESEIKIKPYQYAPAFLTTPEEKSVKILHKNAEEVLKRPIPLITHGGGGIGNILAQKGIPVIGGFGVEANNIHGYNEYIEVDSILPVTKIYTKTLLEFLK